ncbi:MBL fold metallo-hydrolase [Roseofilum casamattae]|uniref:MBL fold metallo-hydrolase n=1 Tax=Roseofilum casamattae BLCC-M143 TaxID=3022442 RepID=A0ABT7BZA1_9CYAN|nr:MBL fold metallo-hydrolase [Roseofilum casamattae]MDJ1184117.1 MBL fold metallo-hydrolase [Roseofilum casamattae BLCC-M143]
MKRRKFISYAGTMAIATAIGSAYHQPSEARAGETLNIEWLGHTCVRVTGAGVRVLVNPFQPAGCTANYPAPKVDADLVLISSQLLDEGYVNDLPGQPRLLFEPGDYQLDGKLAGMRIRGLAAGRPEKRPGSRFPANVAWVWKQAGIKLLHLGGMASPVTVEQKILIGKPDVVFLPVGGGPKAYNPEEAKQAVDMLNPRIVVPTHYQTAAANPDACNLASLDAFLRVMSGTPVRQVGSDRLTLEASSLPESSPEIQVLSYRF